MLANMNFFEIVTSACNWNAARYDQEYNHVLTIKILGEELQETKAAGETGDLVEFADGLADMVYVTIGALWKHGLDPSIVEHTIDTVEFKATSIETAFINFCVAADAGEQIHWLAVLANLCRGILADALYSRDKALLVLSAVCKSNDTKLASKTASNVKANTDKGKAYVSPTEDIKTILAMEPVSNDLH